MIHPVGKGENSINSIFDTDWDKFASDAEKINEKYNQSKEKEIKVVKQTSGNMYSTKNQHRINFPFEDNTPEPEQKKESKVTLEGNNRLNRGFDPDKSPYLQSSKSVSSVEHTASEGSNKKYTKCENSNSIWENDKLAESAKHITEKNQTQIEREAIENQRKTIRQQSNDNLVEALQEVDQRKSSYVGGNPVADSESRFAKPTRNISLFDAMDSETSEDFKRLSELSEGERLSQKKAELQQQRSEDKSWKSNGKSISSKDSLNNLFDALMQNSQGE